MILILGAGGHGQVVADILRAGRAAGTCATSSAFLDDNTARHGQILAGSRVLGKVDDIAAVHHEAVVVALGDNTRRADLFLRLASAGERFATPVHPRSILAGDVVIGHGTMVCAGAIVNTGSLVGRNVIVNTGATVDHHAVVEDHVHIAPGVHIGGDVRIGEGAFIGIGAVVLPRVAIGAWSTVGAGAVVTRDVPTGVTVVGAPARVLPVAARA